jgi:hypothetical protein
LHGGPLPASGSFTYDYATNRFEYFRVVWDGRTFDLTSAANHPYIYRGGPACIGGATGPQATLALLIQCVAEGLDVASLFWNAYDSNSPDEICIFFFEGGGLRQFRRPPPGPGYIIVESSAPGTRAGALAQGSFRVSEIVTRPQPLPGVTGQIMREIAGPAMVPPGVPVEVNLGFVDIDGSPVGPSTTVPLNAGERATLDLNLDSLAQLPGQRVLVRPVVSVANTAALSGAGAAVAPGAAAPGQADVSVDEVTEVFDQATGFGTLLVPSETSFAPHPVFQRQGLAAGQTMQLIVTAYPPIPCRATLGFLNAAGAPIGKSKQFQRRQDPCQIVGMPPLIHNLIRLVAHDHNRIVRMQIDSAKLAHTASSGSK